MNESAPTAKLYTFEEMLLAMGFIIYSCVGTSMLPLLRDRKDIVEIRPIKKRPKQHDIVLYKRGETYILHRVLRVLPNNRYLIAGDNNTFVERDVTDDMILGVMTRMIRNGKSIYPADKKYRLYVHLWCDLYPVRMFILCCIRKLSKIKSNDSVSSHI